MATNLHKMVCFDVNMILIFYKRMRIELIVSLLRLLCILLFPICSLHTTEKDSKVEIRCLKFREALVEFSRVLHILLYWYPLWKIASYYHYTQVSPVFTSHLFGLDTYCICICCAICQCLGLYFCVYRFIASILTVILSHSDWDYINQLCWKLSNFFPCHADTGQVES